MGLLLLLCLSSCLNRQQTPSAQATNLTVPSIEQQSTWSCGLAALQSLYRYYHKNLDTNAQQALSQTANNEQGLSGSQLLAQLQRDHFDAFIFKGKLLGNDVRSIHYHLLRGRPIIVLLKNSKQLQHFVIVRGMEPDASHIYFMDPAQTQHSLDKESFLELWSGTNHFCLLAIPKTAKE